MAGEAIIAACVGLVSGAGGRALLGRVFGGPERDEAIARYYRGVIKGLREENEALRAQMAQLEGRIRHLELAQDSPPPHLG